MRWLSPLALIVIVIVVGGTATAGSPVRKPPRAEAVRDCRTHVEGRLPRADRRKDFLAGPVRFRGFRAYSRFAARRPRRVLFEIPGGHYRGIKFVTEVRAGVDVTVAIGPPSRDSAGLLFDLNGKSGPSGIRLRWSDRAVRFRGCPEDRPASNPRFYRRATVGPWTQFNGGFLFTGPQCLVIDVYVRGRAPRRFVEPFARSRKSCRTRSASPAG